MRQALPLDPSEAGLLREALDFMQDHADEKSVGLSTEIKNLVEKIEGGIYHGGWHWCAGCDCQMNIPVHELCSDCFRAKAAGKEYGP